MPIHPTAIVHRQAEIDPSVEVGPFCVIDAAVRIEAGCRLYQHVYVTGWTTIGENTVLHPNAIVGHEPQDIKYTGERSYCTIGSNCIIRENVTIHRGTDPESSTVVGNDCFLLAGAHVAHNCTLGESVTLINNVLLAGHVTLGSRSVLSGGVGVHQFVRIGELAMISGKATVVRDVVPFALVERDGRIAGVNSVGLRRAGLDAREVTELKEIFRLLFGGKGDFARASAQVRDTASGPAAKRLAQFLAAESKRGFAGRTRE